MPVNYAFFQVPAFHPEEAQANLNAFLTRHRIHDVSREFVNNGEHSAWCLCVLYDEVQTGASLKAGGRPPKVDYREVLSSEDFDVFSPLRKQRNELAESIGVPAYAIFTNEQLATMVRRRVRTLEELRQIDGIGERRAEKYGEALLASLTDLQEVDGFF